MILKIDSKAKNIVKIMSEYVKNSTNKLYGSFKGLSRANKTDETIMRPNMNIVNQRLSAT